MLRGIILVVMVSVVTTALVAVSGGAALAQAPPGECLVTVDGTTYTTDAATCAQIADSVLEMVGGILGGILGALLPAA